jgi:hypothetical protein
MGFAAAHDGLLYAFGGGIGTSGGYRFQREVIDQRKFT